MEPAPVYSKGNGHGNGACSSCKAKREKIVALRDRYELQSWIHRDHRARGGTLGAYVIDLVLAILDGKSVDIAAAVAVPVQGRVVAPLVRPAPTQCAWPPQPCEA